jgi:ribose transport system permease protein
VTVGQKIKSKLWNGKGRFVSFGNVGYLPLFIVVLFLFFAYLQPRFATFTNLQNVTRQGAFLAMVACAQMFPMLGGGFDISVGANIGLVSVIASLAALNLGTEAGFIFGILCGASIGLINGIVIARFRVSPFVATLAMMSAARGLGLFITNGQPIFGLPKSFLYIGTRYLGPIPIPSLIAALVFLLTYLILQKFFFGRYFYAIGGNAEAARLSGVNVIGYRLLSYVICGTLTGIAGVTITSRIGSGEPMTGAGLGLESIAAAVVGGVALTGGKGTVFGVLLGVVILAMIANGLDLINVSSYLQMVVIGCIIVIAVIVDQIRASRKG